MLRPYTSVSTGRRQCSVREFRLVESRATGQIFRNAGEIEGDGRHAEWLRMLVHASAFSFRSVFHVLRRRTLRFVGESSGYRGAGSASALALKDVESNTAVVLFAICTGSPSWMCDEPVSARVLFVELWNGRGMSKRYPGVSTGLSVPNEWSDIDPEWMTVALAQRYPEIRVGQVDVELRADGTNRRARESRTPRARARHSSCSADRQSLRVATLPRSRSSVRAYPNWQRA